MNMKNEFMGWETQELLQRGQCYQRIGLRGIDFDIEEEGRVGIKENLTARAAYWEKRRGRR